jgi:3-hydroxyacyl-CoA dehydrogenase
MNPERLPGDAKALALALAPGYRPSLPAPVRVEGAPGYALLKMSVFLAREAGQISDYDAVLGDKLAFVLSGGRLSGPQEVPEESLLDLEREAFLSLCGNVKTHERIQHLLKTGKPLRN